MRSSTLNPPTKKGCDSSSTNVQYDASNQGDSLSHAHAEDRDLAAIVLDGGIANACIALWVSWARADHQLCRVLRDQVFEGNLIVSVYSHGRAFEDKVLIHIPGEGIVVVNEYNVGSARYRRRWRRIAGRMVNQREGGHFGWYAAPTPAVLEA